MRDIKQRGNLREAAKANETKRNETPRALGEKPRNRLADRRVRER